MRITHLEYKRTRSLGNYENASLAATGQVGDDEEPGAAMEGLREWVELQLDLAADMAQERREYLERSAKEAVS